METSEPLSIESFSYSWLVNVKPSFDSFRSSFDESNFIEMDPKLSASKRFLVFHQDFDFDLPTFQPCVDADQLMSNGILVPLFVNQLDADIYDSSSTPTSPVCSTAVADHSTSPCLSFRRYKTLPKRVVQKYLNFVRLIWVRMRRRKCTSKSWEDFSGTIEACSSENWPRFWVFETPNGTSSPRISEAYGADNWRRSCDSETSIYEAVLHCKKTIGCK